MYIDNKNAFSSVVAIFMVWFLLVLTTGVYNLVLRELVDNRSMWNYLKAYAWAQSAWDLALLKVKELWYWIDDNVDEIDSRKIVLAEYPEDISLLKEWKDVVISYDLWSKVSTYDGNLSWLWYDIIPLFYLEASWNEQGVEDITLWWVTNDVVWNIVWENWWISWVWIFNQFTTWSKRSLSWNNLSFNSPSIASFLSSSSKNYLILFNSSSNIVNYTLNSNDSFTKPRTDIIATWEVWWYKQNLKISLDNSDYLNILKYSIFSK